MVAHLIPPLGPDDHVSGPPDADLELVMYGDFECPYCMAAQSILARVRQRLDGRLRFAYRHFPIEAAHPHALLAAQAAEAAGAQGAFWEMHDALFTGKGRLEERDLVDRARDLRLDTDRFAAELRSGVHVPRVRRDQESGRESGVRGTPGFFANGAAIEGSFDAGSIIQALSSTPA
jgi:protein-disulfide isomerase